MAKILGRIKEIAEKEGITIGALERNIGASKGVLSRAIDKGTDIQTKWIVQIVENYPHYSAEWLLTGEGDMLKTDVRHEPRDMQKIHNSKATERIIDDQTVNLYDFEAAAGLRALLDNRHSNIIDTIRIPNLPKCDGAIHIVGDSMYPLLKSGDIVLYKEVSIDPRHILYGEMYLISYIIDGDDYVVVKYIKKSDKGEPFVTLASQNPHHADRDIDFRYVNALALIKASIRINSMI